MTRVTHRLLAALTLSLAIGAPAAAAPILIGSTVTFELLDDGVGIGDLSDTLLLGAEGDGIEAGDASDIGSLAMLEGEFIRVFNTSISFGLFGGGDEVSPGFRATGYGPGARYVLSDLLDPGVAQIIAVGIVLSDVIDVGLGTEVLFSADSITLFLDTLGILESASNLGTITLNLTLAEVEDPGGPGPAPVPEPGTFLLLASGAAAVAWTRRRRRLT